MSMIVNDILAPNQLQLNSIYQECSQFLEQSGGIPLIKKIPNADNDIKKIKVRKRKSQEFDDTFNQAFAHHPQIRERSIFANGQSETVTEGQHDTFYVFPIDGYKFIYNKAVQRDSANTYANTLESLSDQMNDAQAQQLIHDMIKFNYATEYLQEGLKSGAEIIIYNIPYYYAIRSSTQQYQTIVDFHNTNII